MAHAAALTRPPCAPRSITAVAAGIRVPASAAGSDAGAAGASGPLDVISPAGHSGGGGAAASTAAAPACVLLAAHGRGADALRARCVMRGPGWGAARLAAPGAPASICRGGEAGGEALGSLDSAPLEFELLRSAAGLQSYLIVPVAAPDAGVLGALAVGSARPRALSDARWGPLLAALASALLQHLRTKQVGGGGFSAISAPKQLLAPPCAMWPYRSSRHPNNRIAVCWRCRP